MGHSFLIPVGHGRTPSSETRAPLLRVRPSYLLRDVNRQMDLPQSKPLDQFIAAANSELTHRGFDYEFDVSSFITEHKLTPLRASDTSVFESRPYEIDLTSVEGAPLRLEVNVDMEGPCGERMTLIPAARVTDREIELVVNSRHRRVKRPSTFALEWMQLVDEQTKKPLRTWELPFDAQPLGVSPDGSTLFFLPNFNIYSSEQNTSWRLGVAAMPRAAGLQLLGRPWHLILATSDRGVQFANAYGLIEQESSETLEDQDPDLPYVGYERFHVGDKTFLVRFQWPCT